VSIDPPSANILAGETQNLTITVSSGAVTWPEVADAALDPDSSGVKAEFTSDKAGIYRITVTANDDPSKPRRRRLPW
jgi:hypothetical protein